ncbi:MAG: Gfo/Idh/MocA family oxidoreductase [Bacteroidetes bacterium]|nr:Gfo/Idh/MocA family oxidoreductase [Bacteroidota bacterium]
MSITRIGVVGTGHLGKIHTKLLKNIKNAELVGIFDIDTARAKEVAEEFGIVNYSSLDDFFDNVDAVSIVATTSAHYEIVKKAFEKNVNVFVEKPITATIEEGEEIVKIAREKGLKLQVGHIERFNPALLSVDSIELNPMFIQTDRLAQFNPRGTDVAVVLDLMIHDIDIILSLIKSEVVDIKANGVAVVSDNIDIANARLEFANGAVANVTASRISQKKMRKMRMFQRDAYISLDFNDGVAEVFRLLEDGSPDMANKISFGEMGVGEKKKMIVYEQPPQKEVNALQHELQLFIDCVNDDTEPVVTGAQGLRALIVAQQILKEIEKSKIV